MRKRIARNVLSSGWYTIFYYVIFTSSGDDVRFKILFIIKKNYGKYNDKIKYSVIFIVR